MERILWATTARRSSSYRPGRRPGFARHHGDPEPGTEVHADVHDDPQAAIRELLQAIELPDGTVTWLRHALVAPEPAGQVH